MSFARSPSLSFTRRTGTVVILQEGKTDDTCVRANVRQVKEEKKKKKLSCRFFDNSGIVHIKGDGIIHMTSFYSRSSSLFIFALHFVFCPCLSIDLFFPSFFSFLHLTNTSKRDCTHAICLSHLFKTKQKRFNQTVVFTL